MSLLKNFKDDAIRNVKLMNSRGVPPAPGKYLVRVDGVTTLDGSGYTEKEGWVINYTVVKALGSAPGLSKQGHKGADCIFYNSKNKTMHISFLKTFAAALMGLSETDIGKEELLLVTGNDGEEDSCGIGAILELDARESKQTDQEGNPHVNVFWRSRNYYSDMSDSLLEELTAYLGKSEVESQLELESVLDEEAA